MPLRLVVLILCILLAAACSSSAPTDQPPPDLDASAAGVAVPAFTLGDCGGGPSEVPGRSLCDPVNLVFPDTGFAHVSAQLIAAGWSVIGVGSPEYVVEPGTSELLPPSVQLFETQGQGAAAPRYHVRLWQLANGDTIGAVHHETGGFDHNIDRDWEAAEARIVRDLCTGDAVCSEGTAIAEQQRVQNGDRWRGFRNDGRPAVIRLTRTG